MAIYGITLLNVLNGMSLRGSRVLLSLFAIQLGAGAIQIGVLIALSSIFQVFLSVYAGRISDRHGYRAPMMLGSFGGSIAMLVPYFFPDLAGLYVSRALTVSVSSSSWWRCRISRQSWEAPKCARATSAPSVWASLLPGCWLRLRLACASITLGMW